MCKLSIIYVKYGRMLSVIVVITCTIVRCSFNVFILFLDECVLNGEINCD